MASGDGRYVVWTSNASNLVAGDTNRTYDAFRFDLVGGTTTRVSVSDIDRQSGFGGSGGGVSDNGRFVAFSSGSSDLVDEADTNNEADVFVRDHVAGTTTVSASRPPASRPTGHRSSSRRCPTTGASCRS